MFVRVSHVLVALAANGFQQTQCLTFWLRVSGGESHCSKSLRVYVLRTLRIWSAQLETAHFFSHFFFRIVMFNGPGCTPVWYIDSETDGNPGRGMLRNHVHQRLLNPKWVCLLEGRPKWLAPLDFPRLHVSEIHPKRAL